jgi:hypothetical protein
MIMSILSPAFPANAKAEQARLASRREWSEDLSQAQCYAPSDFGLVIKMRS